MFALESFARKRAHDDADQDVWVPLDSGIHATRILAELALARVQKVCPTPPTRIVEVRL